jgi:hypothetical protein
MIGMDASVAEKTSRPGAGAGSSLPAIVGKVACSSTETLTGAKVGAGEISDLVRVERSTWTPGTGMCKSASRLAAADLAEKERDLVALSDMAASC